MRADWAWVYENPKEAAAVIDAASKRITELEAGNAHLRRLLEAAGKKVALYRKQHSGEYVGGMEFNELMRQIHEALPQLNP